MTAPIVGKFVPPKDLGPAIAQLGDRGLERLEELKAGNNGKIEPWMIAKAADYGREHGEP